MTTTSGASRPLSHGRRAVALVVLSLLLAGLGTPLAHADGGPTGVNRSYLNGWGASIFTLLIGEGVTGSHPTFALSPATSGTELHLIGGPECHGGLCSQWANYYSPDTLPASGVDDFSYTITDDIGTSAPATVHIAYVTNPPRPDDALDRLNPRTPSTVHFSAMLPAGHRAQFYPSSLPTAGSLGEVTPATCDDQPWGTTCTATATFTPRAGLTSRDSDDFYWQVEDTTTDDFSEVAYSVLTFENAPVVQDDTLSAPNDRATVLDVTANDTDLDGDVLSIWPEAAPQHGTLSCTQKCTYTPEQGYLGPDSFTYRASDDQMISEHVATVTLTVTVPPPPAPPAPPAPVLCLPGAPTIRSVAPGARRGPLTAVVTWSAPSTACTGALTKFTVTALQVGRSGAVVGSRAYTAAASARRLEVRLPTARSWRFQVSATGARGTGAKSRASATVVAR